MPDYRPPQLGRLIAGPIAAIGVLAAVLTWELEHVGSMFTIRTVLPGLDATDERPTLVTAVDERLVTVFSGKVGTCVRAAEEVAAIVAERAHAT